MTRFIIANDIGTTRVKSLAVYHSKPTQSPRRFEVESVLGESRELLTEDSGLMKIATQDGEWFIGPSALRYSRNHIRGRDRSWPFSSHYKALHLFSIAQHVAPSEDRAIVDLVSALPFTDRANGSKVAQSLQGTHNVEVGGKPLKITIQNVFFGVQGVSAIMAEQPTNGDTVAWLGLGGRNRTYATIGQGRIVVDKTGSAEGGMLSALDDFTMRVRNLTDLELSESEALEAIRTGQVKVGKETVDVSRFAVESIAPYKEAQIDFIGSIWPTKYMPRVNDLRIGGGGALGIGRELAQGWKQARVVSEPRWTEAQGLLNMGISKFA